MIVYEWLWWDWIVHGTPTIVFYRTTFPFVRQRFTLERVRSLEGEEGIVPTLGVMLTEKRLCISLTWTLEDGRKSESLSLILRGEA